MKNNVEIAELADHFVVVFRDKETQKVKKVMTLNHLGTDILRAFVDGMSQEELIPLLAKRYETTLEDMTTEVSNFYQDLEKY